MNNEDMNDNKISLKEMKDVLSLLSNSVIIIAIYLYFIGWVYINSYYNYFNIHLHSLNLPFYYIFVYSCYAFGQMLSSRIGYSIVIIFLAIVYSSIFWKPAWWKKPSVKYLVVFSHIICFIPFYYMAKQCGKDIAISRVQESNITVTLSFKDDIISQQHSEFQEANEMEKFRLITQTDNRIFVFIQPNENDEETIAEIHTYDIAKDDIKMIMIKEPKNIAED